ncbi:uracil-DNA glycosylase family protein [Glutamicibacter nicotianae]|uniref:uracil-DNA glycosylase family protein n=1 Tax=Glutamicibacter nicotianae TaxID=37929 RepID=UPI001EF97BC6|nr:uracil-DNA glycosylase family protein [Glutamicibacter nicotianae]MBM7766711.1 TDG/mug DNA glycosylase family protein [Glutamicibacter nicotianae]
MQSWYEENYCISEMGKIMSLIGHQERLPDGQLTLADLWPEEETKIVIAGLNPAPPSVAAGHYYQGRNGKQMLSRVASAMFNPKCLQGKHLDDALVAMGIGFTDLVKAPTVGEKDVSERQLVESLPELEQKLAERDVRLVISIYRHAGLRLLGLKKLERPGLQDELTSWGARVFITPNPYGSVEQTRPVYEQLGHEVYGIQTEPVFQRRLPTDWVDFYETVYKVARFSSMSLDEITLSMYDDEVKAKLGALPTPPWRLNK